MEYVYVVNRNNKPLMPCKPRKARKLLKQGKAIVFKKSPFTIKIIKHITGYTQNITLGVDAGSKVIGISASTPKNELYSSEVLLRNDIVELLSIRRELRTSRRNRKTRYRKSRFNNRVKTKKKGWLVPSIQNKINSHLNVINDIRKILPISKIIVETASFDIQLLKALEQNLSIPEGIDYQNGPQKSFWNTRQYVLWRDNYQCQYCKNKKSNILNVHHKESRKTGGDSPLNLITLCEICHKDYHKELIQLNLKKYKSYRDASFMGIMRWTLYNKLKEIHNDIEVFNTYGYITKSNRIENHLPKEHRIDALCISGNLEAERLDSYILQKKIRCHNRQIHKCKILKGNKRKSNQSSFEVKGFRLYDKVKYNNTIYFIWGRRNSGSFLLKDLGNNKIDGINYKKLKLIDRRKYYISQEIKNKIEERSQE